MISYEVVIFISCFSVPDNMRITAPIPEAITGKESISQYFNDSLFIFIVCKRYNPAMTVEAGAKICEKNSLSDRADKKDNTDSPRANLNLDLESCLCK